MRRWRASCTETGALLNVRGLSWNPLSILYMIQGDVITSADIITFISSISINFEYTLRASNPFLIIFHPISLTWASWAGIFCAVRAGTLHPFLLFRIIDCNNFSNLDFSFAIHSVDLKPSYRVCIPIIGVHVQARTTCWSTVRTSTPNIFNPQIGLKCNCISLWDVIYKREITWLGYDWEETELIGHSFSEDLPPDEEVAWLRILSLSANSSSSDGVGVGWSFSSSKNCLSSCLGEQRDILQDSAAHYT